MTTGQDPAAGATVLDRLIQHVRARDVVLDGQVRPVAILWTDPKSEWLPIVELLRARLPELLVLGEFRPDARTGPAIWLRCLVDGALREPPLPEDRPPVVYLPGIARQDLRAGEDCPVAIQPLVELMFRGTLWHQVNGNDWTVSAFLTSPKTVGLDIGRDRATAEALARALAEVALSPVSQLVGRPLHADDFDRMLADDVVRDALRWMGDAVPTKTRLGAKGWAAFCNRCRDELKFDPESDADVAAGERLAQAEGAWRTVWDRFAESPSSYGGIAGLLRRSAPRDRMRFQRERWPDLNDEDEEAVRRRLAGLPGVAHGKACDVVWALEESHRRRRDWVWARMGLSPMATVLEPLARLAQAVRSTLGGTTPDDVASAYLERGWQADAATWEALAVASAADEQLVKSAVRHLLLPWLDDSARAFQAAVQRAPLPTPGNAPVVAGDDVCILFSDGLRYDVALRLAARLEGRGCRVQLGRRWSALPSLTPTGKPAVTPVADAIVGQALGDSFEPTFAASGKPANAQNLRAAMQERGYQVLGDGTFDVPATHQAHGWVEAGDIDTLGHSMDAGLARQIPAEIERLADRIGALLDAGWRGVRIVTDHGWLLMPGGLPQVDLPKHLTANRWSRCAAIAGSAKPDVPLVPWSWNPDRTFATAPGVACFNATREYTHGGLSVQECLTPDLFVERTGVLAVAAKISSITWRGMRCFVVASVRGSDAARPGVRADLRLATPAGKPVAGPPKPVADDGSVSLVLGDDEHESAALVLVLIDDAGNILAQSPTRVGADS